MNTRKKVEEYFKKLRFDKKAHLGLGDIVLTIGQQEEIINLIPEFEKIVQEKINMLKSDKRLSYPTATVFENAPLALVQNSLESKITILEEILKEIKGTNHEV